LFFLITSFIVLFLRQRKVATRQYLELAARIGIPRNIIANTSISMNLNGGLREAAIEEGVPMMDLGNGKDAKGQD
jgi:hypothetical protein